MFRRLAALIFLLATAGQAWAAVCRCDDQKSVPSCCKRKIEKTNYISASDCCGDEDCSVSGSVTPAARIGCAGVNVAPASIDLAPAFVPQIPVVLHKDLPARSASAAGRHKPWRRPPNLYVRHHAFLI